MQASSVPYKFADIWGSSAAGSYINNPIPSIGTGSNATQSLGFPPITASPVASGGIPPIIGDFNGALYYVTAWLQWLQGGGPVIWDSTFSTNIGGYPKGA